MCEQGEICPEDCNVGFVQVLGSWSSDFLIQDSRTFNQNYYMNHDAKTNKYVLVINELKSRSKYGWKVMVSNNEESTVYGFLFTIITLLFEKIYKINYKRLFKLHCN